jgi:hypothetical protein
MEFVAKGGNSEGEACYSKTRHEFHTAPWLMFPSLEYSIEAKSRALTLSLCTFSPSKYFFPLLEVYFFSLPMIDDERTFLAVRCILFCVLPSYTCQLIRE